MQAHCSDTHHLLGCERLRTGGPFRKENAATMRYSWNAVFRDLTPMQLELCSDEVYDELIRTEEIKRMPTFPEKGSMQEMDGVYVIKISEDYLIDE